MTVIVVSACPVGLRGHLTRWLLEISPGVFVGRVSARVRALMWSRVVELAKSGRAIMVHHADNEQGLTFAVHAHDWVPIDHEGLTLIRRPTAESRSPERSGTEQGWSSAGRRRRYGRKG